MTDYTSKSTNLYLVAHLMPTAKLGIHGSLDFNLSEAALDEVQMPDSAAQVAIGVPAGWFASHSYDYSQTYTYSDFDYELLKFNFGFEYLLSPKVTLTADMDYADLTDNQGYVYGNETGSYYMIRSGLRLKL
ncbi:MAG: hypothetical protein P1R58_03355 [bacterium]|nr:hypothetical protein [bacterium]